MKKYLSLFIGIVASLAIKAQSSDCFNYQAIIRDATGNVKTNASVSIQIEILQGSTSGAIVFSETHATTTSTLGLVDLKIGSINTIDFQNINWTNGPYFLRITLDGTEMGTSQLLSVPFALHSKSAENYTETDPIFLAHPANGITATSISNWSNAFGWGNHALAGYLTSFTEADPIFGASAANGITSTNITNWNNAFGWGNHATAGYIKSYTETDPIFGASAANGITSTNITNWSTAFSWGNHATAGYLTSFTEIDPIFGASAANSITSTNITNWDNAFSWGNHAGLYRSNSWVPSWSDITSKPTTITGFGITDFDFTSAGSNDLLQFNGTKWVKFTPNYLTSEVDGSVTNEIQTLSLSTNQLTISATGGNTVTFTNWDTDKTDDVTVVTPPVAGDMLYFNGTNWAAIHKGIQGQILIMNASGVPEWQSNFAPPIVSTQSATFSLPDVILNGVVNPSRMLTTVSFEYGTTLSYGTTVTATQSPVNGSSDVSVSATVSGLVTGTTYHFRVKADNLLGTSYGGDMSFTFLGIGTSWLGGIIFYLDGTGQHGLIAANADQTLSSWGCYLTTIAGADGTAVGTGSQNTTDIINGCATAGIAARQCRNYAGGGYNDWFLPSKDELGLMFTNLKESGFGGFSAVNYWSSSESSSTQSWWQSFNTGSTGLGNKTTSYNVRAARAF